MYYNMIFVLTTFYSTFQKGGDHMGDLNPRHNLRKYEICSSLHIELLYFSSQTIEWDLVSLNIGTRHWTFLWTLS